MGSFLPTSLTKTPPFLLISATDCSYAHFCSAPVMALPPVIEFIAPTRISFLSDPYAPPKGAIETAIARRTNPADHITRCFSAIVLPSSALGLIATSSLTSRRPSPSNPQCSLASILRTDAASHPTEPTEIGCPCMNPSQARLSRKETDKSPYVVKVLQAPYRRDQLKGPGLVHRSLRESEGSPENGAHGLRVSGDYRENQARYRFAAPSPGNPSSGPACPPAYDPAPPSSGQTLPLSFP